jgi:hypothetical protein
MTSVPARVRLPVAIRTEERDETEARRCDGKAIPMKEALRALLMLVLGAIFILGIGIFG